MVSDRDPCDLYDQQYSGEGDGSKKYCRPPARIEAVGKNLGTEHGTIICWIQFRKWLRPCLRGFAVIVVVVGPIVPIKPPVNFVKRHSQRFRTRARFRHIVIDSPPLLKVDRMVPSVTMSKGGESITM